MIPNLPRGLVVGSMCHCDEPDECSGHWEFYTEAAMSDDGEHVRTGRYLSEAQMRAIVALVRVHNGDR